MFNDKRISFSYYAKMRSNNYIAYREFFNKRCVSISLSQPSDCDFPVYKALAPNWDLLSDWKNKKITWQEYEDRYRKEVLDKLDVHQVAKDLMGKICLCWEKDFSRCHRNIVRHWLKEHGYKARESFVSYYVD